MMNNRIFAGLILLAILVSLLLGVLLARRQPLPVVTLEELNNDLLALLGDYAERAEDDPDFAYRVVTLDGVEYRSEDLTLDGLSIDHFCFTAGGGTPITTEISVADGDSARVCVPFDMVRAIYTVTAAE